jgi:Na+:H+ antiporter, NhaA family
MTEHTASHHAVPHHVVSHHVVSQPAVRHRTAKRHPAARLVRFVTDRFLLLPFGALIALVWANTAGESYFNFAHTLSFPVNEIAMAFFLALIAQEVFEAIMPGGALHTWRRWGTPVVAAVGGFLTTAVVYLAYVQFKYELVLSQGWPVACAIDIAAAYYLLKIIFHRSTALPFLLMVAVVTNAAGLLVVAWMRPFAETRPGGIVLMLVAVGLAAVMRRLRVRSFWPYIAVCGTLSWWALYLEALHPALALVPIVPFLPHEARRRDVLADPKDDDEVHHFEHEWNEIVQAVLFMFGLVNAGVILHHYGTGTWALLTAALVGRPLGILAAVGLAVAVGFRLPRHIGWRELVVISIATTSGFTFALFFATGILPVGPVLAEMKLGALTTVVGAAVALAAACLLRVGRFAK